MKQAFEISPIHSAGYLLCNVQDVNFKLKKYVQYHIRKERRSRRAYLMDGVEVDNGSLQRLADMIWFRDALDKHSEGECLDLFKANCSERFLLQHK